MTSPLYADLPGDVSISFEFFPPKTATMEETLWQSIQTLEPLKPRFVSVTYGAGGSTRERTHSTVGRIVRETSVARPAKSSIMRPVPVPTSTSRPMSRPARARWIAASTSFSEIWSERIASQRSAWLAK